MKRKDIILAIFIVDWFAKISLVTCHEIYSLHAEIFKPPQARSPVTVI